MGRDSNRASGMLVAVVYWSSWMRAHFAAGRSMPDGRWIPR